MCGKITIGADNKKVHDDIMNEIFKVSAYAQDAGAEIEQICKLIREM